MVFQAVLKLLAILSKDNFNTFIDLIKIFKKLKTGQVVVAVRKLKNLHCPAYNCEHVFLILSLRPKQLRAFEPEILILRQGHFLDRSIIPD